ncbi:MAG: potassium channel family protein [Longimicrobiales bacterium]
MPLLAQRGLLVLAYFVLWVALGTLGYVRVEGWEVGDSMYMTVITLTAVGYQEVHPLTGAGRVLTGVLLVGGLSALGLWFALVTSFLVDLDIRHVFRRRRMKQELASLKGHVIVCGGGRIGNQVASELEDAGRTYVVVEVDEDRIEALRLNHPQALVLHADATQDQVLREVGVGRAAGLLACLGSDTDNLFVCLSARAMCPSATIVARANQEESIEKMTRAGADHVISPNVTGAIQMASVLVRPSVVTFLDVATRAPHLALRLEQAKVTEKSSVAGQSLSEARIPQNTGLIVIAVGKDTSPGGFEFNPVGSTTLDPGDELIVLGTSDQVESLKTYVS